jgi:hypothetical protein
MTIPERREAIRAHKVRLGCRHCGRKQNGRMLLLVRPDGSGLQISRLLAMASLGDEDLLEEISRRVVECVQCFRARTSGPSGGSHALK